jgi:tetratricopeptide (TPR) repeat protein
MLILRIKRCELALASGRLDEAAELLGAADLRAHRSGQELTSQLVQALVDRGRSHLAAGRLSAAAEDCHRAVGLAGNVVEVSQLKAAVDVAASAERRRIGQQQHAAAEARRLVQVGDLTLGHEYAARAQAAGGEGADMLLAQIKDRRAGFDRCLIEVNAALGRDDWQAAISQLARATALRPGGAEVLALSQQVAQRLATEAQRHINAGHLDLAGQLLKRADSLRSSCDALDQIMRNVYVCRSAWECIGAGDYVNARETLSRLLHVWPQAHWLRQVIDGLATAGTAIEQVRSGPIGLLDRHDAMPAVDRKADALPLLPVPKAILPRTVSPAHRFLLHVDGAGSYAVLSGGAVSIGPVSASTPTDVPLLTAAHSPVISISRSDEDYFLNARVALPVNDRLVASKLLANGDRVTLGPRCRIEFRRPNPASSTAVLNIAGARLSWSGVREVLLMSREIVIGPNSSSHIRSRDSARQVVLHMSQGQLLCRAGEPIEIDGKSVGCVSEVKPGQRIAVSGVSFVIQPL